MLLNLLKRFLSISFILLFLCSCGPSKAFKSWESNYEIGLELIKNDSLDAALKYLNTAHQIGTDIFSKDKLKLGDTKYQLGLVNHKKRNFKEAISLFSAASNIAQANQRDSIYIQRLGKLNESYSAINDFQSAESTILLRNATIAENYGKHSKNYAQSLIDLSVAYTKQGKYQLSIDTIKKSNKLLDQNSIEYITNLNDLSQVYAKTGEYKRAISIQKTVFEYFENADNTSKDYASACFTMSYLYHFVNKFEEEIDYMKKAIDIFGEEHPYYPVFAGNIGYAYQRLGQYEIALNYLQQAVELSKNKITQGYTLRLEKLAFAHTELGEYEIAKTYYNDILDIWDKHLDKSHEDYGQLLNNIGKLYRQIGEYNKAKKLFKDGLDNFLENFDKTHTRYGYMLNDYASMLFETGEKDKAIDLLKDNLQIAIDNDLMDTEDFYGRQHNLAKAYNRIGKFELAIPLLENTTSNITDILGNQHPIYSEMIGSLSTSYLGLEQVENAIPLIELSNKILLNEIQEIFKFRSEKEQQSFLVKLSEKFEKLQSLSFSNREDSRFDGLKEINLNNQLLLKSLLLNNSKNILGQLAELNDSLITSKIESYKSSKQQLSKLYSGKFNNRKYEIDSLISIINLKEADLVKLNDIHFSHTKSLERNWQLVKTKLDKNDIAIEFSNFKFYKNGKYTDSTMYVAYIYSKHSKTPKLIPLFEEKQLIKTLEKSSPNSLYAVRGSKAKNIKSTKGLYELIWSAIDTYLKNLGSKNTIYYSLSGILNQIPLAALSARDQPILAMHYNMFQLSSTNNLFDIHQKNIRDNTLLIGGINYDYLPAKSIEDSSRDNMISSLLPVTRATRSFDSAWEFLPGTLSEVTKIKQLLIKNNQICKVWQSDVASETKFKSLNGNSPNVLHIATHGFFFENIEKSNTNLDIENKSIYRTSKDPLLRSGLIFSGANYAWKNGNNPNEKDDGILTAMEISNLDLSNTNIVILSACETGLGDINGSEGVYGLQRAFKMAGVDIIIMSLWQVPDAETSEFMTIFYENWLNEDDVKMAFNKTQRIMYKKYKNEPLKWAAFVLFE